MPPLVPSQTQRHVQVTMANPQRQAQATARQQQGGSSGTIPGTSVPPNRVAVTTGIIPTYPATAASPHGDQAAGVGIQVLNNAGNPAVILGQLAVTAGGTDCPSSFQEGGFAFVDADGNLIAGYSQPTGLWGFGGGGGSTISNYEDQSQSPSATTITPGDVNVTVGGIPASESWLSTAAVSANITEPGLYHALLILRVSSGGVGSVAGQYLIANSPFNSRQAIPLDGIAVPDEAGPPGDYWGVVTVPDVIAIGSGDVPWNTHWGVSMPSTATGWSVDCYAQVNRLAY